MSSEKVARLLTDFDRPDQQKGRSRVVPFDHTLHSNPKAQPKPPGSVGAPEDDAYQRGRIRRLRRRALPSTSRS